MPNIPELLPQYPAVINELCGKPKVLKALQVIKDQVDLAMKEQIDLCEIEAPTFQEQERAKELQKRMRLYGLEDITTDEVGNVIGRLKGDNPGPVLAIAAHMDTVFPAGTDVKVKQEGNTYRAPGIGDNCSGLRCLLQVLRAIKESGLEINGEILFLGSVGEEGKGDIRGAKHFCATQKIDGFIAVDSTDVGRILRGAVGSHRWRIEIDGPGGHSFAQFGKAPSAIHAFCRAGEKIADLEVPSNPKTTYTVATVKGGTTVNSIAAHCETEIDIRSANHQELLKLEEKILKAFEDGIKEENSRWPDLPAEKLLVMKKIVIGDRPAGTRPDDCPVLQSARAAQKHLGIELTNYGMSSTDANAPMSLGIPSTCLCSGGFSEGAHTLKEFFVKEKTELGPQLVLLTSLALVGAEATKPMLGKRQ